MKVHELVGRCAEAASGDEPLAAVRALLESLAADRGALESALGHLPGVGGNARQAFYRAPDLALLKVRFPSGRRTPPHDHGAWAAILLLSGGERNTLYRRDADGLRRASEIVLEPGSVLTMRAEAVHVAECVGDAPAIGLHVYGGDVVELPRRVWDPDTLEEHALEPERYEAFAQRASRAAAAP